MAQQEVEPPIWSFDLSFKKLFKVFSVKNSFVKLFILYKSISQFSLFFMTENNI